MPHIQFQNIAKSFNGIAALTDVSLSIHGGETHALMGENGAGKSTLAKILAGIHRPDAGNILIGADEAKINSPADAAARGIGMVHQELVFCPDLSIAENLSLGRYPRRARLFLDKNAMHERAADLLNRIGVRLDTQQPMRNLSTAQEQLVQIAAALGTGAKILIFDEPTASLSEREAQQLFRLIADLKKSGVTMIYVSHRMPEVFALCDAISVLRDGQYVDTIRRNAGTDWPEGTQQKIVQMMIGRALADYLPTHNAKLGGAVLLDVRNLSSPGKFDSVSFSVRAGEIVGFAGLVGAGRSEVMRAVFGLDPRATGQITVNGSSMPLGSVRRAMARGIGLVPEDRKRQGLVLMMGGRQNFSLPLLAGENRLRRLGFLKFGEEKSRAADFFNRLRVRTPSLGEPVSSLSGGNQQKVVLAKWLAKGGKVLIVDEPTRGVDVGAKAAIHHLLDDLASHGVAIVLVSSELPEVLTLSTRILVMRDGRLAGELHRAEATLEKLLHLMAM
jgi:ABC-type sugar transport system ATPase subunit